MYLFNDGTNTILYNKLTSYRAKVSGYYYTASMAAQIVTPILSGFLVQRVFGWEIFFPYAALFVALSFVTMYFVKHGDAKAEKLSALEALGGADD